MPVIKILPHPGTLPRRARPFRHPPAPAICEALLEHHIHIEHACDMSCACTTCHVIVREGFASLNELDETEEDLLDRAWGLEPNSRLSCQAIIGRQDLVVEIPRYTINHATREPLSLCWTITRPLPGHHGAQRCDRFSWIPKPPA
jgi:2Fe-2S ferredoxin